MKFAIVGTELKPAAQLVYVAANPKSDAPDFANIYALVRSADVSQTSGLLSICGQNENYMVAVKDIPINTVAGNVEDGSVLFPVPTWQRIVSESSDRTLNFQCDDSTSKVSIEGGGKKTDTYQFSVQSGDQYSKLTPANICASGEIDPWHLQDALKLVSEMVDMTNCFEITTGVCMELGTDGMVRFISTDQSVLGFAEVATVYDKAPSATTIRVLPKSAVEMLERMVVAGEGTNVKFIVGDTLVRFCVGKAQLTTRMCGKGTSYLNWRAHVPDSTDGSTFTCTAGAFSDAASRAEIVEDGMPVSVDIHLMSTGDVTVKSKGLRGNHSGVMEATSTHGTCKFRLDSRLIKNSLRRLKRDTPVQIVPVTEGKKLQVIPNMPNIGDTSYQLWAVKTMKKDDS